MDYLKWMEKRHSVRQYKDIPLSEEDVKLMQQKVDEVNEKSGLRFKLIVDEEKAFGGRLPKYGSFKNVKNYIICSGKNTPDFEQKYGYYGEELVIYAQSIGLNTCWVGLTMNKKEVKNHLAVGLELGCVITLGYGATQGTFHKNKDVRKVTSVPSPWPKWFKDGMKGAMLAPTAVNQQQFFVQLAPDGKVMIKARRGFFNQVDLGIVKYQFEMAAGSEFPGFVDPF